MQKFLKIWEKKLYLKIFENYMSRNYISWKIIWAEIIWVEIIWNAIKWVEIIWNVTEPSLGYIMPSAQKIGFFEWLASLGNLNLRFVIP